MPDDRVDQVDGDEAEQHSRPRERGEHGAVEPERRPPACGEVDEVGEHVRRVRQEEQPRHPERDELEPGAPARIGNH